MSPTPVAKSSGLDNANADIFRVHRSFSKMTAYSQFTNLAYLFSEA